MGLNLDRLFGSQALIAMLKQMEIVPIRNIDNKLALGILEATMRTPLHAIQPWSYTKPHLSKLGAIKAGNWPLGHNQPRVRVLR